MIRGIIEIIQITALLKSTWVRKYKRFERTRYPPDSSHKRSVRTAVKKTREGKQLYGRFKRLINNISHQKTWSWLRKGLIGRPIHSALCHIEAKSFVNYWTWQRKGNLKRETESLQRAAQYNAIRTNHIKARIDKTQQNIKCRLCCDREKTVNHIISKCSKLAQEYKARHDWVGKLIHWEMCRKFQFDHTNKCYIHNSAPVLENDSHKLLWDFNIQTDHLIPARRPDLIIINKKKKRICKIVDFAVPADHRINLKESEKKDKYLDLATELKKLWNMKVTTVPIVIGALGTITKGSLKGLEDLEDGGRVESKRQYPNGLSKRQYC